MKEDQREDLNTEELERAPSTLFQMLNSIIPAAPEPPDAEQLLDQLRLFLPAQEAAPLLHFA